MCSLFERPGTPIAYITDAPTYAGFVARAALCRHARIYSVDMDEEGPHPDGLRDAVRRARDDGFFVPFYYTVPDGHNPAGFSFSTTRRHEILDIVRSEGLLIVEDAPYVYISYAEPSQRPQPFVALDPTRTVHLFTGSKIGLPGPRVGFAYSEAVVEIEDRARAPLADLLLTEASADILFHNPQALRSFESLLFDESFQRRDSLCAGGGEEARRVSGKPGGPARTDLGPSWAPIQTDSGGQSRKPGSSACSRSSTPTSPPTTASWQS